jgi:hypothetical protein
MKLLKSHPLFSLLNSYLIDSPQPVNISYLWNFGSLLGICLVIQIITGIIETGTFDYVLRMLTEIGIVLEFKLGEKFEDMCYLLAIIPLFRNKGKHNPNLISSLKTWLKGKGFIPEFIQGIKHGSSLVTLPKSIENYHNSLLGRMIRVVGGTAAFIVLTINNPDLSLIDKEVHKTLFLTILFIGIYHLSYMVFIYTIRFLYILYHIIKGNWIVRNSTTVLTDVINIESIQSAPLFFIKINNTGKRVVDFINYAARSFDFIKGIKYAAAFPVLPSKIANYHKSLFGRTLRVVGGLAAFITLTYNTDLAIIHTKNYIFYVIAFVGLSHMLYITFIFAIKSAYVLYYILTGKWIHRSDGSAPLKYFLTEGSAAFHCFTGICFVSGTWLGMAGTAVTVDQLIGEDYFKGMAVFKQPALFLKSTFVTLDESIYFGNKGPNLQEQQPTIKDNFNLNENGIRQNSDILNKLHQQEEFDKLKSKIASNPEIKQAFDKIKTELNVDIVKDIDGILKLVKK